MTNENIKLCVHFYDKMGYQLYMIEGKEPKLSKKRILFQKRTGLCWEWWDGNFKQQRCASYEMYGEKSYSIFRIESLQFSENVGNATYKTLKEVFEFPKNPEAFEQSAT